MAATHRILALIGAVFLIGQIGQAKEVCVEECFCQLVGQVDDCCCDFNTVNATNSYIVPVLDQLLKKPFFSYYKTNVYKTCPFWTDEGLCGMQSCALKECGPDDLPFLQQPNKILDSECDDPFHDPIVDSISQPSGQKMNRIMLKAEKELFWDLSDGDDLEGPDMVIWPSWYNLSANPERFTGYIGDSAAKVWKLIYTENCFLPEIENVKNPFELLTQKNIEKMSLEKRAFFRIISGLHTSITTHVCSEFFDSNTGKWGPNASMFYKRFAPEFTQGEGPWRLRNLYFTYLFVLRAIEKSAPYWSTYPFNIGDPIEDGEAKKLVHQLLTNVNLVKNAFDETQLFKGDSMTASQLKHEFKAKFQNITRVMDCVGCTKCRLWGKLQIQGLGTAIKILFTNTPPACEGDVCYAEETGVTRELGPIKLRRNEVVALFNTLGHLAQSIHKMDHLRTLTTHLSDTTPYTPPKPVMFKFNKKSPFGA